MDSTTFPFQLQSQLRRSDDRPQWSELKKKNPDRELVLWKHQLVSPIQVGRTISHATWDPKPPQLELQKKQPLEFLTHLGVRHFQTPPNVKLTRSRRPTAETLPSEQSLARLGIARCRARCAGGPTPCWTRWTSHGLGSEACAGEPLPGVSVGLQRGSFATRAVGTRGEVYARRRRPTSTHLEEGPKVRVLS